MAQWGKPLHCGVHIVHGCQDPEVQSSNPVHAGQLSAYSTIISRGSTEGPTVSSLIRDRWLMLGLAAA